LAAARLRPPQVEEGQVKGLGKFRAGAVLAAAGAILTCAATAHAQRPANLGNGAPVGQSGIQLFNFSQYISNGTGEINPPAPTTSAGRLERVFQFLQANGIKNVELYNYPGHPFPGGNNGPTGNIAGLQALRALGDQYGLRFPGRHGSLTETNWDNEIAAAKILGQDHIGEAGLPGGNSAFSSYQNVLNTALVLNRLGKRSVEAGLGPAYFHNHEPEFSTRYLDNGVMKSAWEIVMDRTDPRWVVAQLDIGWAVCGALGSPVDFAFAQAEMARLINKFQLRVISYHVKDLEADTLNDTDCANGDQRELGLGDINFGPMLAAAVNRSRYYFAERDPVGIGGPTNFNPFTNTANSALALKGNPAPAMKAFPQQFTGVPAGTAAADNQLPIVITNDGDAPMVVSSANNALQIAADANDGGAATAADFAIVSQNCQGATLAPGGTCTVNVGFKPTRTSYTSVARLQVNSNSDNAVERVLLAGRSTAESLNSIGGNVDATLSLQISPGASFGTFVPATARTYETAASALVVSTAGDAALSVMDPDTVAPGKLVNGTYALSQPLNVRALNSAQTSAAYTALGATPLTLLSYTAPTFGADTVTIGFRQALTATEQLRTGMYSKTLTFTLATTTP
jgi:sugar phosphate isomerase/epimerase